MNNSQLDNNNFQVVNEVKLKANEAPQKSTSRLGLVFAGIIGTGGILITALATPFVLPALRKHCLPYVPATDTQLANLTKAFKKHSTQLKPNRFIDIGSGDGRICRLASEQALFSQVDGVELNYLLVIFSRLVAIKSSKYRKTHYYHKDLWKFPLTNYDTICIFGVESIMKPLEETIKKSNNGREQTVIACRFPFPNLNKVDEIGSGIDTVWVYKVKGGF